MGLYGNINGTDGYCRDSFVHYLGNTARYKRITQLL